MVQSPESQPAWIWPRTTRLIARALMALMFLPGSLAYSATQNEPMNPRLREFLEKEVGLNEAKIKMVIAARPVAKVIKTKTNSEVAIFGIVRIRASQDLLIEQLRDIVNFESGKGVSGVGLFHSPPTLRDVDALKIDEEDLKEIRKCKAGNCAIKLSDRTMSYLKEEIDWNSPKANSNAQSWIRKALVDYVASYQKIGDEALAIYNDQKTPQGVHDAFSQLLDHSSRFIQYDPQLANYLDKYPLEKPPDTEDIFYWQSGDFGLRPVVRASHLAIHRTERDGRITYTIASKMLYSSHYFRAALELKGMVPDSESPDSQSFYLICLNRSFVDGLTGLKGRMIRGTVVEKSRKSLEGYLVSVKRKIEVAAYKERQRKG